jgi:hypothetical protein
MCEVRCEVSRRQFLATATATAISAVATTPHFLYGAPSQSSTAETFVGELYESLTESQRNEICLSIDNPVMKQANANWHVTNPLIGSDFYTKSQQALIEKIARSVTSADGYTRLEKQMADDDGGLSAYSIAIFGKPGDGQFQWLLTGRHLTLRADGNTMKDCAFGGPLVYGHGEESSAAANLFYDQTVKVNQVFEALDNEQRKSALLNTLNGEDDVFPKKDASSIPGLAVANMSAEQKIIVKDVLAKLLSPYRDEDAQESLALIESSGGIDALRFAFFQDEDLESDKVWDMWRIEGPNTVIHFRGAPHVHAYINIGHS